MKSAGNRNLLPPGATLEQQESDFFPNDEATSNRLICKALNFIA